MANNFVSIGYFPYLSYTTDTNAGSEDGEPALQFFLTPCEVPRKRNPLWYNEGDIVGIVAPTGDGSPYPFSLSLREAMAMFWKVKSWRVECSIPSWTLSEEGCIEINGASINETWNRQVSNNGFVDIEKPTDLICNGLAYNSFGLEKTFTTSVTGTSGCEDQEPIESSDFIEIGHNNLPIYQDGTAADYFVQAGDDLFYLSLIIRCGTHQSTALSPNPLTEQYYLDNEISAENPDGFATFVIAGSEREVQIPLYNWYPLDSVERKRSAPTIRIYPAEYFTF